MNRSLKSFLSFISVLLIIPFLGVVVIIAIVVHVSYTLPDISTLYEYDPSVPSKILTSDGHVLMEVGKEKREVVSFEKIPAVVVNAVVSAEDDKFFEHKGVDYSGIMRAFFANLRAGRVVQGGSTLTQQVAKTLLLSRERSYVRKIQDFLLALEIERKLTKQEILYLYLNQVYLGGGYYGIQAAFKGYFEKDVSRASAAEAALIAGLLAAPGKYSPYVTPKAAKNRQIYVLSRMRDTGRLSSDEYEKAAKELLKIRIRKSGAFEAGYFTDWIRQKVVSVVGEEEFLNGGFTVKTTLDWTLQKKAESAISVGVKEIDRRQGFQGPLRNIESRDEIKEADLATRKKIYEEGSDFLLLLEDGETVYEYAIDEAEIKKIENFKEAVGKDIDSDFMIPGYYPQDRAVPLIRAEKSYQAVVILVQDSQKIIYLSIGGVSGFIPYEGFKWAHPRKISEETSSESFISRPSGAVKSGDVVWVTVRDTKKKVWDYIDLPSRSTMRDPRLASAMKTQLFVRCDLDQEAKVQSALVAMDPHTGEILSLVGGTDFEKSQFNRAVQSLRQPGSSFKPFIYAAALENGHTPASILVDTPEALVGVDDTLNWKPSNYDGEFKGRITLRRAIEESRNVPTIRLAGEVGMRKVQAMSERFGLKVSLANDLSAALGSFGITLLDLVTAYSIFPNGGNRVWPKAIVSVIDKSGKVWLIEDIPSVPSPAPTPVQVDELSFTAGLGGNQVYDPRLAHLMVNLMRGVIQNGTGQRARGLGPQIAGKTGTTNNHVDAWFMGFSPAVTVGVWAGFDDNTTLGYGETGAKTTLPMWIEYMREALKRYPDKDFVVPEGIVNVLIDEQTGKLAGPASGPTFLEAFVEGMEPGGTHQGKDQDVSPSQAPSMPSDDDYFNQQ